MAASLTRQRQGRQSNLPQQWRGVGRVERHCRVERAVATRSNLASTRVTPAVPCIVSESVASAAFPAGAEDCALKVSFAGESAPDRSTSISLIGPGATRRTSSAKSRNRAASILALSQRPFASLAPFASTEAPPRSAIDRRSSLISSPVFGQLERQRPTLDLRLAYSRDPNRMGVERKGKIDIAEKISARADIGKRIDIERVRLQVHEHTPAFDADGPGQRQGSCEGRSLQYEIQIARDETRGRQIHVADRRDRSIGQDFANGGKARAQIGGVQRQPIAQALHIADSHVDPALEIRSRTQRRRRPTPEYGCAPAD